MRGVWAYNPLGDETLPTTCKRWNLRAWRTTLTAPLLVAAIWAGGCRPDSAGPNSQQQDPNQPQRTRRAPAPVGSLYHRLQHEDPSVRMAAVLEAGRWKRIKAVPYLVDRLTDSEAEVRFAAIQALQKITGQTMGYRYYEPSTKRDEAARRWRKWLGEGEPAGVAASRPSTRPATQPTTRPTTQPTTRPAAPAAKEAT